MQMVKGLISLPPGYVLYLSKVGANFASFQINAYSIRQTYPQFAVDSMAFMLICMHNARLMLDAG